MGCIRNEKDLIFFFIFRQKKKTLFLGAGFEENVKYKQHALCDHSKCKEPYWIIYHILFILIVPNRTDGEPLIDFNGLKSSNGINE